LNAHAEVLASREQEHEQHINYVIIVSMMHPSECHHAARGTRAWVDEQ